MSENLKRRFEFQNSVIQSQAVGHLVAAILKEKGSSSLIKYSSDQTPALNLLWEKCCCDNVVVRTASCEALVALVAQNHAEFNYVLNGILNLIPSARNVQGLIRSIGKLLQMQVQSAKQSGKVPYLCPYAIRNPPHPYIVVLENRPDSWPYLLQQISSIFQQPPERLKPSIVLMMTPFFKYLYCEPHCLRENAELRLGLLQVVLQSQSNEEKDAPNLFAQQVLRLFFDFVPHLQVTSLVHVTEAAIFLKALSLALLRHPHFWKTELAQLSLQLLCVCEVSLNITGEFLSLIHQIQMIVSTVPKSIPAEEMLVGLSLLLLHTPVCQQHFILELALKILTLSPLSTSSKVALVLVMPLLQIASSAVAMECTSDADVTMNNQQLAVKLLDIIQSDKIEFVRRQEYSPELAFPITGQYKTLIATWKLLYSFSADADSTLVWLSSVKSTLPLNDKVPEHITLLIAYIILREDGLCLQKALETVAELAKADASQVPHLISVLMFKLGRPLEPALCRAILYTLPTLGTHKVCVSQIIHALQVMWKTPKLKAISLRLMTSLWENQDRVYPELQKYMALVDFPSVSCGKEDHWEQLIAKAASIREICRKRSYQHGADMLAAILKVLNECTKSDQVTPAVLALQGLHALCQTEVVDIRSTWYALSSKLSCDTRPLVVKALNEMFALVPSLNVKSTEYEKFREQVVSMLWSHTQNKDSIIASSAYKALSVFSPEEYTILHLPEEVRPERKDDYELDDEMELNAEEEEKEEDLTVPGASYIKLLLRTPLLVLSAFEEFLSSLVKQELTVMPRGIYYSALRGGIVRSDQGKAVAGIPNFMLKTYEKNKQPGLKSGLAAGLLLCYDLHIQTDKDGKPINRFLVSRGRSYQQMLAALIHEVPIQPSEWHKSILMPQAWLGFMSRTYQAVLQGRQAELEMQQKHGKDDPEELQYKQFISWLWARDMLTDVIKSASKDSPVVQGNSILALTGLAVTVAKHESSLPSEANDAPEIGAEILPTKHWISMVVETLLSIVDNHYRPKGRIFPWFQHKSYSGESTASAIARSCAATALTLLVPVFITSHKEVIEEVLSIFTAGLPGKPSADESQAVQFHTGLAMGMFLSRLYEERMSDVSAQKMNLLLMKSLDALEKCCFDMNLEYNAGCILGVGLVLSLMSHSSQTESRVHVSVTFGKLCTSLDESLTQSRVLQEVLAYSVACICVSAFKADIIQPNEAEEIMSKLRTLTEQSQQIPGFAMALGTVVHGLAVSGHGKAEDLRNRLLPAWLKILLAEGCPTMHRLAAINGLVALVGSESSVIQLKSDVIQSSHLQSKMNEVIRAVTQIISFSGVIGLQSNAAYVLGHLHLTNMSSCQSRTSVPPDFRYLPEKSVLRNATDYIIEAGKKGPESVPPQIVKVLLAPIAGCGNSYQYPPLNWASILTPLKRLNFGEDVQQYCIEIAVTQAQTSQSAAMFLETWIAPPLVYGLNLGMRKYLFTSLASWMKHVPEDKLQTFVEVLAVQYFTTENRQRSPELCTAVLQGINEAMKVPNQVQHTWGILCRSVEKIFEMLPNEIQVNELNFYVGISKCLSEFGDTEIDRVTQATKDTIVKVTFVRGYLVSQGRVPLLCFNDIITTAIGTCCLEAVTWIMLQSFYQSRLVSHQNTGVTKRMEWLLELMGHIRNVAYGSAPTQNPNSKEATDFVLHIFAAAVAAWSDHATPLMLGVKATSLSLLEGKHLTNRMQSPIGTSSLDSFVVRQCFQILPQSILLLLSKQPWKEQTQKFIDWFFVIVESPQGSVPVNTLNTIKATLLALRFLPEYKKKAVWTRTYGW
ncbi:focadhesin isoform X1 [Hypanus sabinus]|uniref:focadhesin isoform X1 n=2 Tax=Hypanus sabinus TaxID=79690 RepID=UPI0028C45BE4|nr:focadhesin isoform X1 [Hypanus sabinus]XP_059825982.1 focadhesin isoform X1 [Hypanus sabinus]XP_059825983.1 focadhesin isoform X1 [Hypanus sabinus]XP_059825984.1 focadhesin isoform X1 [Hypanus sabinus]XP_059825985.1 focadhesin isoform X1 [Hypanus sabinus]XP_059825986.1 focadhesin isoform X1 [Hypanus sabinus]XP_059825987.1 focadhesin isoform X1 [Hypanus sabinus]XP_059825988.1 focadhesin isoform X1 [Hypanus sabinus]XP_059825990.1 focadhesin isoform X1 [Hypanus sabinus]XP_059825991.1 focad